MIMIITQTQLLFALVIVIQLYLIYTLYKRRCARSWFADITAERAAEDIDESKKYGDTGSIFSTFDVDELPNICLPK